MAAAIAIAPARTNDDHNPLPATRPERERLQVKKPGRPTKRHRIQKPPVTEPTIAIRFGEEGYRDPLTPAWDRLSLWPEPPPEHAAELRRCVDLVRPKRSSLALAN